MKNNDSRRIPPSQGDAKPQPERAGGKTRSDQGDDQPARKHRRPRNPRSGAGDQDTTPREEEAVVTPPHLEPAKLRKAEPPVRFQGKLIPYQKEFEAPELIQHSEDLDTAESDLEKAELPQQRKKRKEK